MSGDGRGLGRLPSVDHRDRLFLMREVVPAEAPPVTTRHYRCGPILDQGATPSCVGHAWRQFLSSALMMTRTGPDAMTIYREAQRRDEWAGEDYAGTSVRAGAKYLKEQGRIIAYFWAWHVDDVRRWLLSGRGVIVVGTDWPSGFLEPDRQGFVRDTQDSVGGHAYVVSGYSDKLGAFRCVNSWGRSFGDNGRFWLPAETLQRLITDGGECVTAIETTAAPA